ncbi:MAG: sensor histidine kinase [Bacteroidetes bacterium]|nr:sensor histidine kinase [Bacteroidota bacterium]
MANKRIRLLFFLGFIFSVFPPGKIFSQHFDKGVEFDSIYKRGLTETNADVTISKQCLKRLEFYEKHLSPIQKAKINYLRLRVIYANKDQVKALEKRMFTPPDSLGFYDSLLYSARKFLERSMPDKAVPLLMKAIDTVAKDSEKADNCLINLCEAYRQKQEFEKGVDMLNELLSSRRVSDLNRAYAYNRLAALYNEWGNKKFNNPDSVIKYSELCITLSEKINSKANLALSQNELSFQLNKKKQYDKALELSLSAEKNFKETGMLFCAMNTLITQSNIYIGKKDFGLALQAVVDATDLCAIEENRNLFKRLYLQFAKIYELTGNYKDAFDFLGISYQLQSDFFIDRMNNQINEQSARYDLFTKEQKLREEEQKNEFHKKQFTFLIIILIILCIAFILTYLYLRLRRKEFIKQKLIEAVIETEDSERKRIARDLHDGLGPVLSAINHYFQAYTDAKEPDREVIQTKLHQVISGAIDEVSRISHNISPYILENHGLITALNDFLVPLMNNSRIKVDLTSDFSERFELNKELMVYRCITELLNNTMRHANATSIILNITCRDKVLYVFYSDNGKGCEINLDKSKGMGLINIKNRVETFGGRLVIESSQNKGIQVNFEVPVHYE